MNLIESLFEHVEWVNLCISVSSIQQLTSAIWAWPWCSYGSSSKFDLSRSSMIPSRYFSSMWCSLFCKCWISLEVYLDRAKPWTSFEISTNWSSTRSGEGYGLATNLSYSTISSTYGEQDLVEAWLKKVIKWRTLLPRFPFIWIITGVQGKGGVCYADLLHNDRHNFFIQNPWRMITPIGQYIEQCIHLHKK